MLQATEESFDPITIAVALAVQAVLADPVRARRNDRLGLALANEADQLVGVESFVGDDRFGLYLHEQSASFSHVVHLTAGECKLPSCPMFSTSAWIFGLNPPRDRPGACGPFLSEPTLRAGGLGRWWSQARLARSRHLWPAR